MWNFKGGQIQQLYNLVWVWIFFSLCQHLRKIQVLELMSKGILRSNLCHLTPHQSGQNSLTDCTFLSSNFHGFPDLLVGGSSVSQHEGTTHEKGLPAWGWRDGWGEESLQQKLHSNMTRPHSPLIYSMLLVALFSLLHATLSDSKALIFH